MEDDGVIVITVAEPSKILEQLLRIYPVADPVFECIEDVRAVLEAAMKYRMADVVVIMRKHLIDFSLIHANPLPLRVFAIACRHRFVVEAKAAADHALDKPLHDWFVPELEEISAGTYFRLLQYHKAGDREYTRSFFDPPISPSTSVGASINRGGSSGAFDMPDGDVVLYTSDAVKFRVHKHILRIGSPVFQTMFTDRVIASLEVESIHLIFVFFVDEDSRTLTNLLRFCYPFNINDLCLDDDDTVKKLLAAAMKYRIMDAVKFCIKFKFADIDLLSACAIACACSRREGHPRWEWENVAKDAARRTLQKEIEGQYVEELEDITGADYHRLLQYRQECSDKASEVVSQFLTDLERIASLSARQEWVWYSCSSWGCPADTHTPKSVGPRRTPRAWWYKYVRDIAVALESTPHEEVAQDPMLFQLALVEGSSCSTCKRNILSHLREFSAVLADAVKFKLSFISIDVA